MVVLLVIATLILVPILWTILSVYTNYSLARRINLPIIISPVSPLNPFYILLYRFFPPILSLKRLPFGLGTWARCTSMGWTFEDKYRLHHDLGPLFTLVTPAGNEVWVAEGEAAHRVLAARKEFVKPGVNGDDWQRHRRLTVPSFNESISSLVWDEAQRQARDMLSSWLARGMTGTRETVADTATLALHVLTCAGFGASYSFDKGVREIARGHEMTYRDSLSICLSNIITFAIVPKKFLELSFMPRRLNKLGMAVREFQGYMDEMLARERKADAQQSKTANLMSALVRASDDDRRSKGLGHGPSKLGLSDEEIFGNIFAYNLAGHETTANSVACALTLLAAHPEYQNWVREELQQARRAAAGASKEYEEMFPQLHRCLAVMYETLRLYGSIVFIPRATTVSSPNTHLPGPNGETISIPASTAININVQALHTDPKTWGNDSLVWRPDRWLTNPDQCVFFSPPQGNFIPWADGPRVCPGQKFAQVEFVAVLASLLDEYKVGPALQTGETEQDGRNVLMNMVEDSAITAITLQMREPRKRALRWEKVR
ncbi:MAG: hypothetical protein Q9219_004076 [cf. Caloplaca sp. 3 TL-2023]